MRKTVFIHSTGTAPFMWDSVLEEVVPSAQRVPPANLGYPPYELSVFFEAKTFEERPLPRVPVTPGDG